MQFHMPAKQLLFCIAAIGGAAVLIMLLFMIRPLLFDLTRLHGETQSAKDEYGELVAEENSYRTARTDFAKIESNAAIIQSLFPVKEELVGQIEQLEAAAVQFQDEFTLNITDPTQEDQTTGSKTKNAPAPVYAVVPNLKNLTVFPYDFALDGTYLGIMRFLQTIERQPFYSEIELLSLSSQILAADQTGQKKIRSGRVHAQMRAAFYARKID